MSSEVTSVAHDTVNALFSKFIGPFAATMVSPLLVEASSIEERVGNLVTEFTAHPELLGPFSKLIASVQNKESVASIEEQIRFFQSTQTRNYLFVCLFNDILQIKELELDQETGRLPGTPKDLLNFSNQARVEFGEESRYKDLMCAIGLLFDFAFYLQKTQIVNMNGIKLDEFIETSFKKGVKEGKAIILLSRHIGKLTLEKHAPVAALLRQLSHVILCLLYPNIGPDFYKKLMDVRYTEQLKLALEMKEFGIHSGMVASYLAQSFPIFDPLGEMMSVWGMPHIAHYTNNMDIHDLACIAGLGVGINENYKLTEILESSKVGLSIPEFKFFDYTVSAKVREDLKNKGKS